MMVRHFGGPMMLPTGLAGVGVAALLLYGSGFWWATVPEEPAGYIAAIDSGARNSNRQVASGEAAPPLASLPPANAASSRYQLQGVAAGELADGSGVALIAIDGGAARAYRVGAAVDGHFVLLGVSPGGAILGPPNGPPVIVLDVAIGAPASGPTTQPGQNTSLSATAAEVPPAPDTVAPAAQSAAGAAADTPSVSYGADEASLLSADDLSPSTVPKAQATSSTRSLGRRMRLQRLNSHP